MLKENLKIAIKASVDAGVEIMKVYKSDFEVEYKNDASPLTIADKNANDVINSYLLKTNIPIISEENAQTNYEERKGWNKCWIVDPLDGTKEFVKRNGEFTVNIALIENGKPLLGVIYVPASKEIYYADVLQKEAYYLQLSSVEITIDAIEKKSKKILSKKAKKGQVKVVGSRSHMNQDTLDFVENLKTDQTKVEIVSKGSSLKFCLVAEGIADIYPRFAPTMEWDTAAGQAICEALGIKVISKETNDSLLYNKENLLNPYFLVSRK
jgi:3'(2'), 5'-bisphosphate nucleotidase